MLNTRSRKLTVVLAAGALSLFGAGSAFAAGDGGDPHQRVTNVHVAGDGGGGGGGSNPMCLLMPKDKSCSPSPGGGSGGGGGSGHGR